MTPTRRTAASLAAALLFVGGVIGTTAARAVDPPVTGVVVTAADSYDPGGMKLPLGIDHPAQVVQGTRLLYVNADVDGPHTLTAMGLDESKRPLFDTGNGDSTQPGQYSYVEGVERLPVGSYQFQCRLHTTTMQGWLEVVPPPA